ncbi:MFS transporter, partial [Halorubrum sp. Atlit-28R]|uniref:MFS transporter n=1 Tax=Halorubrum sp. Atlit-28R TaxID=2282129 RepID=UPI001F3162D2
LLIGVVLSLFGFLNSFSQPFTGSLSDRTGRRRVFLLTGLALVAVGSAGYLVFTAYGSILVMRALQGLGAAFTIPVTVALVNELSDEDERGGNFGLFNTFRLLGFGTGPLVAGGVVRERTEVQRERVHRHPAVVGPRPLLARAVAVDLDAVAL